MLKLENIALAALTVLVATLLVSAFALGVGSLRTTGGFVALIAALAVFGALAVEPYRRIRA